LFFNRSISKLKLVLFAGQIVLVLCSVFLAMEKQIPWFSQLFYNKVNTLKEGFNKVCGLPIKVENVSERYRELVEGDLKLYPNDTGFRELSDFILDDLRKTKSEFFAATWDGGMSFEEFKRRAFRDGFSKMTYEGIPGNRSGINIRYGNNRIKAYLNNSSNERTDYATFFVYKLLEGIEKEYRSITLFWALVFVLLSSFIPLLHPDWWRSTTNKDAKSPHPTHRHGDNAGSLTAPQTPQGEDREPSYSGSHTMRTLPRCRSGWVMPTLLLLACMIAGRVGRRRARRLRWNTKRAKEKYEAV
jgi:hypothetical protein